MIGTKLKDRVLHADGTMTVPSIDKCIQYINLGVDPSQLHVTEQTDELIEYNRFVKKSERITIKSEIDIPEIEWIIPSEYSEMDLNEYLYECLIQECTEHSFNDTETAHRLVRLNSELSEYHNKNLDSVLKAIIYVINTLKQEKQVWGVGRGSSVASYVLYLIGVHDVDSVLYELDIKDFLS